MILNSTVRTIQQEIELIKPFAQKFINRNKKIQKYFENNNISMDNLLLSTVENLYNYILNGQNRHSAILSINRQVFKNKLPIKDVLSWIEQIVEVSTIFNTKIIKNKDSFKTVKRYIVTNTIDVDLIINNRPTTYLPIDWVRRSQGFGYKGGYRDYKKDLVTIKIDDKKQPKISDKSLLAINYMQKTKWVLNNDVFKELMSDYNNLGVNTKLALDIAKYYKSEVFYFPHHFDYRGRIYATPTYFSPQGNDAVKGLLQFAEAEKLDYLGEKWCWVYLTNLFNSKLNLDFESKVAKGKTLLNVDYRNAKEPYQFLAHQMEMKKWCKNNDYYVKTPIHVDAHAPAFQILFALTKDKLGLEQTNVMPSVINGLVTKHDFYKFITDEVLNDLKINRKQILFNCEDPTNVDEQIEILEIYGREISKKTLMNYIYGGREINIIERVRKLINSESNNLKTIVNLIIAAYKNLFHENLNFFKQIKSLLKEVCKNKNVPYFETIDGFTVVCQKYNKKQTVIRGSYKRLDNTKVKPSLTLNKDISTLNKREIINSIQANVIHSIDATLLRFIALKMKENNIVNSTFIHDDFGTSPNNVYKMLLLIKQSFIEIFEFNIVSNIFEQLKEQALKPLILDKRLKPNIQSKELQRIKKYNSRINKLKLEITNSKIETKLVEKSEWAFC